MTAISSEFLDLQAALAGEYSLERELGRGGMGIVYLARDVQLDRDVAIKVLPTHLARQPDARDRFLREARTAAGLSHPHIVPIHRVGEAGGFVFFVMSYVAGQTLGERLRESGPLAPAEVTRIMREVAWALAYAHGRGIVHRDVKPDNVLLELGTGRAMVTDFGIAHGGASAGPVTDPGRIMGTAHFMSPEQAASEPVDGRSDIYALGVVGYLALSGLLPFESSTVPALLLRQATEGAPPVMSVAPGLPTALAATIDRCLQRDASARFPNGEVLAAALVPPVDTAPAVPAMLRAWLATSNPATIAYGAWSGLCGIMTLGMTIDAASGVHPGHWLDVVGTAALGMTPVIPIVGFHLTQARRLFRAGYSLRDLRSAIDVARREHAEVEALAASELASRRHSLLRYATYASVTASGISITLAVRHMVPPPYVAIAIFVSVVASVLLAAASNALEVPLMPVAFRKRLTADLRGRLWRSRLGAWLAPRLGAPERSRAAMGGAFRATEVALGVAAADLYAALPAALREQLAELPATVNALERHAAEARVEIERLAGLAASSGAEPFAAVRAAAANELASTVAALEGIRLDLLRLHAGASDLAPLTTLLDAARLLGDDMGRLARGQREAEQIGGRTPIALRPMPTPV